MIAEHIRQRKLGGLLLLTPIQGRLADEIAAAGLPTVSLNWHPRTLPLNHYVGIDYRASARDYVAALLARRSVSRLLYLAPTPTQDERSRGVGEAAVAAACPWAILTLAPGVELSGTIQGAQGTSTYATMQAILRFLGAT